jgi:hypothetical protein
MSSDPISFRPNPAEEADIKLFTEDLGLYDSVGSLIHTVLTVGFREMKMERGIIPPKETP